MITKKLSASKILTKNAYNMRVSYVFLCFIINFERDFFEQFFSYFSNFEKNVESL